MRTGKDQGHPQHKHAPVGAYVLPYPALCPVSKKMLRWAAQFRQQVADIWGSGMAACDGFVPVHRAVIVPVMERVLGPYLRGGGAKAFNFQALSQDLLTTTMEIPFRYCSTSGHIHVASLRWTYVHNHYPVACSLLCARCGGSCIMPGRLMVG
jgi:hypothetical protein